MLETQLVTRLHLSSAAGVLAETSQFWNFTSFQFVEAALSPVVVRLPVYAGKCVTVLLLAWLVWSVTTLQECGVRGTLGGAERVERVLNRGVVVEMWAICWEGVLWWSAGGLWEWRVARFWFLVAWKNYSISALWQYHSHYPWCSNSGNWTGDKMKRGTRKEHTFDAHWYVGHVSTTRTENTAPHIKGSTYICFFVNI